MKKLGFGKKAYPLLTFEKRTVEQTLNPKLTKEIKDALGPEREVLNAQKDKETHSYRNPFEKMRESRATKIDIPQRGKEHEKE